MTTLWSRDTSHFNPDRCPTAQRYFLRDHAIQKSPMQHAYRDSVATLSFVSQSPNLTPELNTPLRNLPSEDELVLPAFDALKEEEMSDTSTESPWTSQAPSADDTSLEDEPSRHVDYLSHDWREEDIWSSWRYVTSRRNDYSNGVRLENASWRTWAKAKHNLKTISPESLNWCVNSLSSTPT